MKKSIIMALVVIGSLTGCARMQQQQNIQNFNNAMTQLNQQLPQLCGNIEDASKTRKAFTIVKCRNDAKMNLAAQYGINVPGVYLEQDAQELKAAAEFDKGKINKDELIARMAEIKAEATEKLQALNMQQQQVDAAQQAARAQQIQAYAQQRAANAQAQMAAQPVFVQPAPVTNNMIHCSTMPGGAPGYSNTNCY